MEDTIEICSGCGKMPRPVDRIQGFFACSRCGCRSTIMVSGEDYEHTVSELDQRFHQKLMSTKAAEVKTLEPEIGLGNPGPKKKSTKASKPKKPAKAKKTAKPKKTKARKALKKAVKKASAKKSAKAKAPKKKAVKKAKKKR